MWRHVRPLLVLLLAAIGAQTASAQPIFFETITVLGTPQGHTRTFGLAPTDKPQALKLSITDRSTLSPLFAPWDFVFVLLTDSQGNLVPSTNQRATAQIVMSANDELRFFSFHATPGETYTLEIFGDAGVSDLLPGDPEFSSADFEVSAIPGPTTAALASTAMVALLRRRYRPRTLNPR